MNEIQQAATGDRITGLPYEIMESVWSKLSLCERVQCTRVCKSWHSLLLKSRVLFWDLSGSNHIVHGLSQYKIRPSYIRCVDLEHEEESRIGLLIRLGCSNIHTVLGSHYDDDADSHGNNIQELLKLTGHTVTTLDITTHGRPVDDFLIKIFTLCPNLTHLKLTLFPRIADFGLLETPQPSMSKIVADSSIVNRMRQVVDLEMYVHNMNQESLKRILPLFASLRHVYLKWFQIDGSFLDWLDNTFPQLQSMGIIGIEMKYPIFKYGRPGYKAFACSQLAIKKEQIQNVLNKHWSHMTALHIYESDEVCLMALDYISTSRHFLCSLVIENSDIATAISGSFDIEHITQLFPCLEQLVLLNITLSDTVSGDLPLTANRTLKTVKLLYTQGIPNEKLRRLIQYRFRSSMECICLIGLDDLPDVVLDALSENVSALDRLYLSHIDLRLSSILKLVNNWTKKKLGLLEVSGPIKESPKKLTHYAKTKLPKTKVTLSAPKRYTSWF